MASACRLLRDDPSSLSCCSPARGASLPSRRAPPRADQGALAFAAAPPRASKRARRLCLPDGKPRKHVRRARCGDRFRLRTTFGLRLRRVTEGRQQLGCVSSCPVSSSIVLRSWENWFQTRGGGGKRSTTSPVGPSPTCMRRMTCIAGSSRAGVELDDLTRAL